MTPTRLRTSVVVPTRDRPGSLGRCLDALDHQVEAADEIVVVDDGSADAPAVERAVRGRARIVRGAGAGPATARNLGASAATGDLVCFTDDDCRPGTGWVAAMADRIASGAAAVAGPTRNGRPDDVWATASQIVTNHLAGASRAPWAAGPPFAPTSNLAVRAGVLAEVPFDETFPLAAGEDREWCDRLAARGHHLEWEPAAWVDHHQDLSARRFWHQQERYGRGAQHLRRTGAGRLQPARFYLGLVRRGFAAGPRVGALVLVAQVATGVGIVRERRVAR